MAVSRESLTNASSAQYGPNGPPPKETLPPAREQASVPAQLPSTGFDLATPLLLGAALLVAGLGSRRKWARPTGR